jgi:hypothetical protein
MSNTSIRATEIKEPTPLPDKLIFEGTLFYQIKDYPLYYVSRCGKVYGWKRKRRVYGFTNHQHYWRFKIRNQEGVKTNLTFHGTVAKQFIPNPENKPTVNHIDGNKANNSVSNLEWATYSEQMSHVLANSLRRKAIKGTYHTPFGDFSTIGPAAAAAGMKAATVYAKCKLLGANKNPAWTFTPAQT